MKILSVSDRVVSTLYDNFDAERFPKVDLILSCGDLPPEYLSYLVASFNIPLYYVRGNHDIRYDSKPPDGCIDLNARLIRFQGVNLLGFEGSRWYSGGPHQYTENEMRKIIRGLRPKIWWRKGIDIIITHAPPRYIHDAEDLCHRGFKSFRHAIFMMQKICATEGLKAFDGSLTATVRSILSMATFMQISVILLSE